MSERLTQAERDWWLNGHDCPHCPPYPDPALDHWNEKTGHWYCPHRNEACQRHPTTDAAHGTAAGEGQ